MIRCAVCGQVPDLIACEEHGCHFVCACNTASRTKRAWYWFKARWIDLTRRLPAASPDDDWDKPILPELLDD